MILSPRNIRLVNPRDQDIFYCAEVIVGVGLHNQAKTIRRCLNSIFEQNLGDLNLAVVLLDDNSTDGWEDDVSDLLMRPEMIVLIGNCGSPARTRNAILDYVDKNFTRARWVARLDADDRFACSESIAATCGVGDSGNARYVLGGNRLVQNRQLIKKENPAHQALLNSQYVLSILSDMATGTANNELPSCNLMLAVRCGWRYPDIRSAEDHWLVSDLLLNHADKGAILEAPYYCDYTLFGAETLASRVNSQHSAIRRKLHEAAVVWQKIKSAGGRILGHGQEGVVRRLNGHVEKYFYPNTLINKDIFRLEKILSSAAPFLPSPEWDFIDGSWVSRYCYQPSEPAECISIDQAHEFLAFCLEKGFVGKNIKRENFRVATEGRLFMVDIGRDIVAMRADYFRDSAARLYAIAALGWPDGELLRKNGFSKQEDVLSEIPGFEAFYSDLILTHAQGQWAKATIGDPVEFQKDTETTLLIKGCAMDVEILESQVLYIVALLSKPRKFSECILLIDPYKGPFLRQHCSGDLDLLLKKAGGLVGKGIIDRIIIAPERNEAIEAINLRWFGLKCSKSHTNKHAPVTSQLWGFEQVASKYVLQCDVDVLIGRHDLEHDYLTEMINACSEQEDVLGVAFNIPFPERIRNPYDAPSGEYVPEVRCGLLDLVKIKACRPLPNKLFEGSLTLTWHRSLQQYQRSNYLRTLRGGDARSFYVHPENQWKSNVAQLANVRDLIAQGKIPSCQLREWNLKGDASDWTYPARYEDIVFLLKGRNTPTEKTKRCLASLLMQDDQNFGLIVIDDASDMTDVTLLQHYLRPLRSRTTLIRRNSRVGRIPNFITAISDICINQETLVVILDLDDALISSKTVSILREKWISGHDVIIGEMFRPDKPLKLYFPSFNDSRLKWGGDVWIHLRSFRKKLFDSLPDEMLKIDGHWIEECTDYATMIPMVEAASSPVFINDYLYCHHPTTVRTPDVRLRKQEIIKKILAKQAHAQQKILV